MRDRLTAFVLLIVSLLLISQTLRLESYINKLEECQIRCPESVTE